MTKILDCVSVAFRRNRCSLYARNPHLVCAVHPTGVEGDRCPDFELDLTLEPEELWQPVGAAYYNGELVLQPEPRLNLEQQLVLLDWHPLFTGRCPNCEEPIACHDPVQVHWDCSQCGWRDDSL